MRFAFVGTSPFAVAILEKLYSDFYYPEFVITQPDRPAGRKRVLTPPPVKEASLHHRIPVYQPEKISELAKFITDQKLDLLIVASYGQIIPKAILDIPSKGAINIHASLLPAHRGASPIQAALLAGEETTGITIMAMDEKMDHGGIIFQQPLPIDATDTYRSLHTKLATLGAEVTAKILPDFIAGRLPPRPQSESLATYTKLIDKEMARLAWTDSAAINDRKVRAFYDWPIAWTTLPNGKRMNIVSVQPVELEQPVPAGTIVMDKNAAAIACSSGALLLETVQVEGKQKTSGEVFARGYHQFNGQTCQ